MTKYNSNENALELGEEDSLSVGEYELEYSDEDDSWQARYDRPIGGERGFHAEIPGRITYTSQSKIGNYAAEADYNDWILTPYKHDGTSVTLGGFAYVVDDSQRLGFFGHHDQTDKRFYIQTTEEEINGEDELLLQYGFGNDWIDSDIIVPTNEWFHIALTFSTSTNTLRAYFNGDEITTKEVEWIGGKSSSRLGIFASADEDSASWLMNGRLDDIRIYNTDLTSSEINDWANESPTSDGLSHNWDFEYPETPNVAIDSTGDPFPLNNVPRSTDESLVPRGLAESVAEGKALADDGEMYDTVQAAVDAASGWVFVGPGTFNENVSITTNGLTLEGSGNGTLIDGSSNVSISIEADNINISNLLARSTADVIKIENVEGAKIKNIEVENSEQSNECINISGESEAYVVESCKLVGGNRNIVTSSSSKEGIISSCTCSEYSEAGIRCGGGDIVSSNIITDGNDPTYSIAVAGDNNIVKSNRTFEGNIRIFSSGPATNNIVANNRANDEVDDGGTGTVLDDNLTGASN